MIWLTHLVALLLSLAGFFCLAAVMDRHADELLGRAASRRDHWRWRGAGITLLVLALALCIRAEGTSIGIAAWLGLMTPAAMLVGLWFTRRAQRKPARQR